MPIIGKLLKKTTEISYKRNFNKGKEYINQLLTLEQLLNKAKNTKFGFLHSFSAILQQKNLVASFQDNVPITDYDSFYDTYLKECIDGKKDITWPGRIKYYALSSGTTGSPSKRIPITEDMIRSFQKTSIRQVSTLHELDLPETFYSASFLAIGGSTKLSKRENHIEGDLSGILKKHTSFILNPFSKPGNAITEIKDWNKKLAKMVEKAPEWNIGIIAGVPSWCILLMEKIVEHYKLNSIHDIWPNLSVYIHGGVFIHPYVSRLEKLTNKKVHLLDTYLASEGYFAYQTALDSKGMKLLLNTGVFYEFVPFNRDYFDQTGKVKDLFNALSLSDVVEGVDYALVISTNAGLWRYMIGDLVRFVNVEEREIIITGRIKQYLSLVGEHLSLENINVALQNVCERENIHITEFCLFPDESEMCHHWFIGASGLIDTELLMEKIDQEICQLNDDYASVRKMILKKPILKIVPEKTFYNFMENIGKSGSQNKIPRVMNNSQKIKWLTYLKQVGLED